jgi:hypothetical protein
MPSRFVSGQPFGILDCHKIGPGVEPATVERMERTQYVAVLKGYHQYLIESVPSMLADRETIESGWTGLSRGIAEVKRRAGVSI